MKFPEQFRWKNAPHGFHTFEGEPFGMFIIPGRHANGRMLMAMAANGKETGWEHVSVSLEDSPNKCPSWPEMSIVRDLFWSPEETVVQFHPAHHEYVNFHPGCLHLWRYIKADFPTPPAILVGPQATKGSDKR